MRLHLPIPSCKFCVWHGFPTIAGAAYRTFRLKSQSAFCLSQKVLQRCPHSCLLFPVLPLFPFLLVLVQTTSWSCDLTRMSKLKLWLVTHFSFEHTLDNKSSAFWFWKWILKFCYFDCFILKIEWMNDTRIHKGSVGSEVRLFVVWSGFTSLVCTRVQVRVTPPPKLAGWSQETSDGSFNCPKYIM